MSQLYKKEAALSNRQSYTRKPGQQRQGNEATNISPMNHCCVPELKCSAVQEVMHITLPPPNQINKTNKQSHVNTF